MPFKLKLSTGWIIGLLLALFFAIALFLRVYFPYHQVFVGDWIKYTGNDAYYQMRLVDNMVHNFPGITAWDPYLIYPDGSAYGGIHFFNYLLAFVIWLFTFGHPTAHAVDVISVYYPAVLAALTVIPVYFIGKALFNRWAGVIAAGIIAVMPGEFMGRSILGGTDQHVAEILFIATAAMFTILALKSGWQNKLSWNHIIKFDWKTLLKPLVFSVLAGIFLGIYLLTWLGAPIFIFILVIFIVIQSVIDHLRGESFFYLGFTAFFVSLVALIMVLPQKEISSARFALILTVILPLALLMLSRLLVRLKLPVISFPVVLAVLGALIIIIVRFADSSLFNTLMVQFTAFFRPGGPTGQTTIEAQPFLYPNGTFTIAVAWGNFTTSMFLIPWAPIPGLAIIALVWLIVLYFKNHASEKPMMFFFIWSIIMVIATIAQRRFAYYSVLNMALLSAFICWLVIWWFSKRRYRLDDPETLREQYKRSAWVGILGGTALFGWSFVLTHVMYFFIPVFILGLLSIFYGFWAWARLKNKSEYMLLWTFVFPIGVIAMALSRDESVRAVPAKKSKDQGRKETPKSPLANPWLYAANIATLVLIVFMSVFWPNWDKAKGVAAAATFAPSNGWEETLHWLKNNTPEPLPAGSYEALFPAPADGSFDYPATAYSVTSWWDYGYWITRTAHRIPSANPSQDPFPIIDVANLLLSADPDQEQQLLDALKTSYIVIDDSMVTSKFWAIVTWANKDSSSYSSIYYYPQGNQLYPIQVYNLGYYKILSVRLFNFNGKGSTGEKPVVITWEEKLVSGQRIRVLSADPQEFDSYQQALDYKAAHPDKNIEIVGSSPYVNPVPVDAVTDFSLVFGSTEQAQATNNSTTSSVKVFQYTGSK